MIRSRRSRPITWLVVGMVTMLLAGAAPSAWSQTGSSSIKFLSPTSFSGEVPTVTDAATEVNSSYRLSAWVAGAPQGAMVEFELVPGDAVTQPITIGAGRQVAGDTYEYDWDIAEGPTGVVEGQHTLKATLYDAAGEELSADTTTVNIIHGSTSQTEGEVGIDLTYPVSGGPLGWYAPPGGNPNSVFDPKRPEPTNIRETVQAWFTTAAPGSAPVWRLCNSGESPTRFPDGVRCTYPVDDPETDGVNEAVDPSQVTAVGVVLVRDDGSADVVRVLPYQQDPTALRMDVFGRKTSGAIDDGKAGTLSKPKDPNDPKTGFGCSDWVRVTATDQVGRHVAGANLDAHAQGPSDQLKFHTSYLSLDPPLLQPPSEGHSFPESGAKCVSTHDAVAKQGEHGMGGQPDRKHVETTSGTRDNGTFDYALESDQPGTTQLTVWLEKNDDDRFCSGEPSTVVGFGWGTEQPQPNGEQPSDCAVVAEPEPELIDGTRTVDIEVASTRVRTGRSTTVVGSIEAANGLCEAAQLLKLKAKRPDASRFRTISSGVTDSFGLVGFQVKVKRTKVYRVVAPTAGECVRAKSSTRKIRAI